MIPTLALSSVTRLVEFQLLHYCIGIIFCR